MAGTAPQIRAITTDELRNISVDLSALLDAGELLSGIPAIQCSDDLTIANPQVNGGAVEINGALVAMGMAVQFQVSSQVAGSYRVEILCGTDAGQTVEAEIRLTVRASRF